MNFLLLFSIWFIAYFTPINTQHQQRAWVVVADPLHNSSWWLSAMGFNGTFTTWKLLPEPSNKLKIRLKGSDTAQLSAQLVLSFNSSDKFELDLFDGEVSVKFTFLDDNQMIKEWNIEEGLQIMVNEGKLVLQGQDFYIWINLHSKQSNDITAIYCLLAILFIKTTISCFFKFLSASHYIGPALLLFLLLAQAGTVQILKEKLLYYELNLNIVGHLIMIFTFLPLVLQIYNLFRTSVLAKKDTTSWKDQFLIGICSIISILSIFIQLSWIAIMVITVIQTILPVFNDKHKTKISKITYIIDFLLLLYLYWFPITHQLRQYLNNKAIFFSTILLLFQFGIFIFRKEDRTIPVMNVKKKKK